METKADQTRMELLRVKLGYVEKLVVNCTGTSGCLCFFWSDKVQVVLLSFLVNHIDVKVAMSDNRWWRLTGFYDNPVATQHCHSWTLLRRLASMSKLPWICLGDFNEKGWAIRNAVVHEQRVVKGLNVVEWASFFLDLQVGNKSRRHTVSSPNRPV
ncbi:hypothetical protein LWI28_010567 [Acer negundo]|uniref:Endonuclease/exonuclease/phosphatase domain-containing protein n=1 Tax=Acer negundo TaxID=4023 RepID=A0AAD5NLJ4_ACENE|nr:hypothetical protein LWI28_010567 [Acer negundo]